MIIYSILTLVWQLFVLSACCLGSGLYLRFLVPKEFSFLNKLLLSLIGGLFLVVLVPQNLFYLGLPVRISAWLVAGAALVQGWLCRRKFVTWSRVYCSSADARVTTVVILLTIAFHGFVPTKQGLEWYYGKGYEDQFNYVLLAEFLKEENYSRTERDATLRPWMARAVGFQHGSGVLGMSPETQPAITGLIKERIGQSIVTAEISAWSGTDGKGGYVATVIFFLTLLAMCEYAVLREAGVDRFMAGSGGLLAAILPAVTRLSLNGFLSQVSILFVLPFLAILLRRHEFGARAFILFFSLALAYLVAAYTEIAPIGCCILLFGTIFVRHDNFRSKRLMLMSAILLVAAMNPYYVNNFIVFLGKEYSLAANLTQLENLAPNVRTMRGWAELIFGFIPNAPIASFFDYSATLCGFLFLAGVVALSSRDKLVFGAALLPGILIMVYLTTRTPFSSYPIAKIALTMLPFAAGLMFILLSRIKASSRHLPVGALTNLLCLLIVVTVAAGSARYHFDVLNDEGLLRYVREPRFLNVCRALEDMKSKRILIFETNPWLIDWLCYHGRHNEVIVNGQLNPDLGRPRFGRVSTPILELDEIDFVATRDRVVDLKDPNIACLTLVDDMGGEDRADGHDRYWLGPPASFRFLAFRTISANLKMRLAPRLEASTLPIDYLLSDDRGKVSEGEIVGKNVAVKRMKFPHGFSTLYLSVKAKKNGDSGTEASFPPLAELDGIELSDIDLNPGE